MVNFILSVMLLALQAIAVIANNGNFTTSCGSIALAQGSLGYSDFLNATCSVRNSSTATYGSEKLGHDSKIDLNLCLGINQANGHLEWDVYGKFSEYCHNCSLVEPVILTCICAPIATGVETDTAINLDEGIGNTNGSLACVGGMGS